MTGFTNRLSNLPPGCTDREIEEQANPTDVPRLLREITAHLSAAKDLAPVLLDAIIYAGRDNAGGHRDDVRSAAQLASRVESRLGAVLSRLVDFGASNEAREEVAWMELLMLAASWKEG